MACTDNRILQIWYKTCNIRTHTGHSIHTHAASELIADTDNVNL